MATVEKKLLVEVKKLYYKDKLSIQDVANKLNISIDSVFYGMRKNGLKRRRIEESNSIRYEREALSFKVKKNLNEKDRMLKTIGVMLYWGEGGKSERSKVIDFANSDKDMVVLFLKFLRRICGVDRKRLRVYPYLYANQNINKNVNYWVKITKISKKQFTKPYVRKDFDENKKDKMPHGLVHIRYSDKKLFRLIKNWIEEYKKF